MYNGLGKSEIGESDSSLEVGDFLLALLVTLFSSFSSLPISDS